MLDLRPRLEAAAALTDENFPDGVHTSVAGAGALAAAVAPAVLAAAANGAGSSDEGLARWLARAPPEPVRTPRTITTFPCSASNIKITP